jgi:hypothetical protein
MKPVTHDFDVVTDPPAPKRRPPEPAEQAPQPLAEEDRRRVASRGEDPLVTTQAAE